MKITSYLRFCYHRTMLASSANFGFISVKSTKQCFSTNRNTIQLWKPSVLSRSRFMPSSNLILERLSSHQMNGKYLHNHENLFMSQMLSPRRNFSDNGTSSAAAKGGREGETLIKSILKKAFPASQNVKVEDISGGCGSMYQVYIEAKEFEGLSIVKQHQLVNRALKNEIKDMHGIRIQTEVPRK